MLDEAIRAWIKEHGLSPEQVEATFQASVDNAKGLERLGRFDNVLQWIVRNEPYRDGGNGDPFWFSEECARRAREALDS